MKSKTILIIVIFISVSFSCHAKHIYHPPKTSKDSLKQVTNFSGQLVGWAVNTDYIYEGFYLQAGCTRYLIVFSPNMGKILRKKLNVNSLVIIDGLELISDPDKKMIKLISIKEGEETIYDILSAPVEKQKRGERVLGCSKINELQKDHNGEEKGFVLDNQVIVHMPPAYLQIIDKIALVGTKVSYQVEKQALCAGEVSLMNYTIINCNAMTIDGKKYPTK